VGKLLDIIRLRFLPASPSAATEAFALALELARLLKTDLPWHVVVVGQEG